MYKINHNGDVINEYGTVIPVWDDFNHLTESYKQFLSSGGVVTAYVPQQLPGDVIKLSLDESIQKILDSTARSFGYDSMDRAVSYINSKNELWKEEAEVLSEYRDSVWYSVESFIILNGFPQVLLQEEQLSALLPPAPTPWVEKIK